MGNQIKKTGPKPRVYSESDCAKAWDFYITKNLTAPESARRMKITVYRLLKMIDQQRAQGQSA